ncbi:unnamed protein product [Oppiella nova]|uniref:Uncharacterized protein n=1 Tax=Oppiella nova TaxID=334625 RepID=A0A7R9M529_9ACAR|nr:unnamed protein product [Oppiella nova]CAG2170902.1 unnamed protein product [Oppiella nova]
MDNIDTVRSEYVVEYYNSWFESKYLCIQMEYCSQNLRTILVVKPQIFGRQLGEAIDCVEYFVSCEIFRQILESVQLNERVIIAGYYLLITRIRLKDKMMVALVMGSLMMTTLMIRIMIVVPITYK